MLEFPQKIAHLVLKNQNQYKKYFVVQSDDNKSWHNDPLYLPTRFRMLSRLAEVVYKLRNEISYESITSPIEGYICPRRILRTIESALFYGSQLKSIYEDLSTIKIRGNRLLIILILTLILIILISQ